jgi:DNA-binding MarR family transcriptional regulator
MLPGWDASTVNVLSTGVGVSPLCETASTALDDQTGHLLRCAHMRASAIFCGLLSDDQLTPPQYFAMARLSEHGRLSQNHLGRLTAMRPATIKGVILRLCERGFILRTPDPNNRRRILLRLTAAGSATVENLRTRMIEIDDAILAPLDAGEKELFLSLLKRLG